MAAFEKMQAEFEQALLTSLREKMKEREVQMQQDFERRSAEQKVLYEQREKHILERIGTASAAVKNDVSVPVGPKVDAMGIAVGDSQAPSSVSCHSVEQASVGHVTRGREDKAGDDLSVRRDEDYAKGLGGPNDDVCTNQLAAAEHRALQAAMPSMQEWRPSRRQPAASTTPRGNAASFGEQLRSQLHSPLMPVSHIIGSSSDVDNAQRMDFGRPPLLPKVPSESNSALPECPGTPAPSMIGIAPLLEMARELKAEVAELRAECSAKPKVTSFAPNGWASSSSARIGRAGSGSEDGSQKQEDDGSGDSDGILLISSSTLRKSRSAGGGSGNEPNSPAVNEHSRGTGSGNEKSKEAEKITGIPKYPTTAEWGAWQGEVRYAVSAASASPQAALEHVLGGEIGLSPLEVPFDPRFETLDAKWGKEMRAIVTGDLRRELMVLEEQELRINRRLLNGRQIYSWINCKFQRDAKLARPQILSELRDCSIRRGGNGALAEWIVRWETTVEHLIQAGAEESD